MIEAIKKHISKIEEKLPQLLEYYRKFYAENDSYKNIGQILRFFQTANYDFIEQIESPNEILDLEEKFGVFVAQIDRFLKGSGEADFDKSSQKLRTIIGVLANKYQKSKDVSEEIVEQKNELQNEINQSRRLFIDAMSRKDELDRLLARVEQEKDIAIEELKNAKEGKVAYVLAEQFEGKAGELKNHVDRHERQMRSYVFVVFMLAAYALIAHFASLNYFGIKLDFSTYTSLLMIIAIKLPIIFMIFFHLNEYGKAKKLYEEYENKRIMAATLVNSLNRIKAELQVDTKELIEIVKTPMERIFDNPVHSIYGDKSGDKNSMKDMLEQFDKLSSIIDKMKKPN